MQLEHEFTVPVPPDQAWPVLLDIQRIAPCMPGATLDTVEDDSFRGRVKVKVGPIQVTYGGTARFVETDESAHRAVIEAKGKEARGTGTASMTVTAELHEAGDGTRVVAVTDLSVTGKPAQFGRGVMAEVGGKIIDRFAECLAAELTGAGAQSEAASADGSAPEAAAATSTGGDGAAPAAATAGTAAAVGSTAPAAGQTGAVPAASAVPPPGPPRPPSPPRPAPPPGGATRERPTPDAIDLLDTAGAPVLKRLAPVLAALAALITILVIIRGRRRS